MVAPVAITISKAEISPVLSVIAIAIASNLQGAATLRATPLQLWAAMRIWISWTFLMNGCPGMFWIEQIGMAAATAVVGLPWLQAENRKFQYYRVRNYFPPIFSWAR